MAQRFITLILLLCSTSAFAGLFDAPGRSNFIPADQAFVFDFQQNQHDLSLTWQVKEGYYLYRKQVSITPAKANVGALQMPAGEWHEDEFYGKSEIYRQRLSVPVTVNQADKGATLTVTYQGCADAGFCYPPETKVVPLSEVKAAASPLPSGERGEGKAASDLPFSALWALLIGIGIAFTPCVLPMYPLISGIVLGGKQRLSTTRALLLAFIYVQGMALTYTALGLVVAAAGLQFQAALQHPYVLIGLSAVFILLALSMFGLFTLQLPSSLQTRLTLMSNRQQGGSAGGVFAMGAIAGLICSPCTTAPLSAILLYIAQSGNLWLGGGTLYLYALGMGLPLILVTVFGNRLLPKSGPWMETVKTAFGFVILALPVFLLERIIGDVWGTRLWAMLGVAFFSWAFIVSLGAKKPWM
ncbi:TPA: protein-disulfide reductase DsbD, partial [Enterobacter hormaechei subsp. steigerwaltii]|nr:protein-disulfide reductase DsbD [Enterobacter hormaechei subsp. steigerwaltii]